MSKTIKCKRIFANNLITQEITGLPAGSGLNSSLAVVGSDLVLTDTGDTPVSVPLADFSFVDVYPTVTMLASGNDSSGIAVGALYTNYLDDVVRVKL